jgi:DNA repair photolyase
MKKDITLLKFSSIAGFRGDSLVCPQAFGGDIFAGCSMGCWWCFCREMEEQLYNRYYTGWSRELVRPCSVKDYEILFERAFGTDKPSTNWIIQCLRYGLPFNMGSKAETFCIEDRKFDVVAPVLELFKKYKIPLIIETKSHYIGLKKYLSILQGMRVAVIVAIMGGSDTLNFKLEPGAPHASMRWKLVEELNERGIWTAVRWEPILIGINSGEEIFCQYAQQAVKAKAKHISFYNYRTSNAQIAQKEFEKRGYNYIKLLENNLDENWRPIGKRFFEIMREYNIPTSSPDFVNFPFDSDCESCCGVDVLFKPYEFTFQHACTIIENKGFVCWADMEEVSFKNPDAYERMKSVWNGKGQYYSLADSPEIFVLEKDKNGMNIYGRKSSSQKKKEGLVF